MSSTTSRNSKHQRTADRAEERARTARTTWSSLVVALGIVVASAYGLLADRPYRGLDQQTLDGVAAQDVCSVVVAVLLVLLARRTSSRLHLVRLGLFAYVAYSYAIYLTGVPMNRAFLVYVLVTSVSVAALLDGLLRLRPAGWPRTTHHRLERGTGWMMLVIASGFAALWLGSVLPLALGGSRPASEGPGGAPYPVFVLDLVVVLPCIAAVGVLLLRGRSIAGPLVVVVLVKIITLFTALWAGVVVGLVRGTDVHLAADAGPSLLMLLVSFVVVGRWWRALDPVEGGTLWPTVWDRDDLGTRSGSRPDET